MLSEPPPGVNSSPRRAASRVAPRTICARLFHGSNQVQVEEPVAGPVGAGGGEDAGVVHPEATDARHTRARYRVRRLGGVPEWLNGAVSKTVVGLTLHRGFESLPLRLGPRTAARGLS